MNSWEQKQEEWDKQIDYEARMQEEKERELHPGNVARYDAKNRFYNMNKFRQTLARVTGQWKKFEKLSKETSTFDLDKEKEVAEKLDKMFR